MKWVYSDLSLKNSESLRRSRCPDRLCFQCFRGHWYDFLSNAVVFVSNFQIGSFLHLLVNAQREMPILPKAHTTDWPTMTLDLQPSSDHRSRVNRTLGGNVDESALAIYWVAGQCLYGRRSDIFDIPATLYSFLAWNKNIFTDILHVQSALGFPRLKSLLIVRSRQRVSALRLTNWSLLFLGHSSPAEPFELSNLKKPSEICSGQTQIQSLFVWTWYLLNDKFKCQWMFIKS